MGILSIIFCTFSTKNYLFDCKTPFLAERKHRITNVKLENAIKFKNTGFYGDFFGVLRLSTRYNRIFSGGWGVLPDFQRGLGVLPKSGTTPKMTPV